MYYYSNLNTTEPVTRETGDLELGLTRGPTVRAAVESNLDNPVGDPRNVPSVGHSEYGEVM